ncbi:MAG TPA: M14 family zinc carboxypeptidase [Solirubrobacterales bacterium]|nr:M14 family zinc carboxypeptidase [Solirubrobacterales bacterium]
MAPLAVCFLLVFVSSAAASGRTVIGHSVDRRPIIAVHEGSPDPALKVVVFGCIHGDETAGMRVARRLIAAGAPHGVELWVVPTLNPDGVAADTRGNAHGVDLNRNFSFDWTHLSGGEYSGTGPLSEPESRAARRFISREQPDLTIWFHQPFGIVDESGGNLFVERRFADLIGLPLVRLPGRYPGSATRWQNHTYPHSTAFVTELPLVVSGALVGRATTAVRTLARELAGEAVDDAEARSRRRLN